MLKQIKLKPVLVLHNYAKVAVIDFPDENLLGGRERQRCQISVAFAEADVDRILAQATDFAGCMKYYEEWLYEVVKINLGTDWECVQGWDEVMKIIEEHVAAYVNK